MTIQKAVILNILTGRLERLQPGDSLDIGSSLLTRTYTTATSICMPVYVQGNGQVERAKADAVGTVDVIGLCAQGTSGGQPGPVKTDDVLVGTTGEWDVVTDDSGGLTTGSLYFLSDAIVGHLLRESTHPTAQGRYLKRCGLAMSPTELLITLGSHEIKL